MLENPYKSSLPWYRGNLHTHTTRSDGKRDPQVVIDDYADRGYDFLMISDHDMLTAPSEFDSRGMVMIPGNEVTARGPHLLHVNAERRVEPQADRQAVIDDILTNPASMAIMAHPNWHPDFNHIPQISLEALQGYVGIEVYNGVIERLPGGATATDRWDQLLGKGRRVWGFAHDDSHAVGDVALGWNVVQADERSAEAILSGLRRGSFYGSTGVTLDEIDCDGQRITVTASEDVRFCVYREYQRRIAVVEGTRLEFEAPTDDRLKYLRVEAHGPRGRVAWTQPFFRAA